MSNQIADSAATRKQPRMTTFVRYIMLGATGVGLGLLLTWSFHEILGFSEPQSVALSLVLLFIFNFFMARLVVFKAADNMVRQGVRFFVVSVSMRLLEYGLFLVLFYVAGLFYLLSYILSILIVFIVKYFLYKNVVFRPE